MKKMLRWSGLLLMLGVFTALMTGCFMKPYDKPEFVTIEPNQTAFVIPLEGATSDQGQFESVEYLQDKQVATKRIQIPHKWVKTGRMASSGEWQDTVRVIVVDRFPETREWLSDPTRGTSDKPEGFIGESNDSIKFKVGMSATAQIIETDTATFLYRYAGKPLTDVMDFEIRNKIGTTLLEKYGTMNMAEIRGKKQEVIEHVRNVVTPYFKERGITLSNIGYVGDLEYVDPQVQESINANFKAEQEKIAQDTRNQTLKDQAKAEAEAAKTREANLATQLEIMDRENQRLWIEALREGKIQLPSTLVQGEGNNSIVIPSVPSNGGK